MLYSITPAFQKGAIILLSKQALLREEEVHMPRPLREYEPVAGKITPAKNAYILKVELGRVPVTAVQNWLRNSKHWKICDKENADFVCARLPKGIGSRGTLEKEALCVVWVNRLGLVSGVSSATFAVGNGKVDENILKAWRGATLF